MLFGAAVASAATVYRWVDSSGVVHYSDQPSPGATKVEISEAQHYSAPAVRDSSSSRYTNSGNSSSSGNGDRQPQAPSMTCDVSNPDDDAVIFNVQSLRGGITISPSLSADDHVTVIYDGKPLPGGTDASGGFTISPLDRGTHTLAVEVAGEDGQIKCRSQQISFHVRQPSVNGPASPIARPH